MVTSKLNFLGSGACRVVDSHNMLEVLVFSFVMVEIGLAGCGRR
jgi:hypothetical protein